MSTVELVTVDPPLTVQTSVTCTTTEPSLIRSEVTTLILHKNIYADAPTAYSITDTSNNPIITLQPKSNSIRDKRLVLDAQGHELYYIQDKLLSIRDEMVAKRASDSVQLFKVVDESTAESDARMKVEVTSDATRSGDKVTLELLGDWYGDDAQLSIWDTRNKRPGQVVATASRRSMDVKPTDYDDQTYFVRVAPGVDLGLMAGIAVCFDEIRRGGDYGAP